MQSLFKSQILLREREHKSLVWVLLKEPGVVIFCSSLLSQLQSVCYINYQHQSLVLVVKTVIQGVVYVSASSQSPLKCWTRITSLTHTHLFRQNLLLSLKTKGINYCIITFNEENSPILSKETECIPTAVIRFRVTPSGPAWFLITLGPPTQALIAFAYIFMLSTGVDESFRRPD